MLPRGVAKMKDGAPGELSRGELIDLEARRKPSNPADRRRGARCFLAGTAGSGFPDLRADSVLATPPSRARPRRPGDRASACRQLPNI
jgi:hypothetical protein